MSKQTPPSLHTAELADDFFEMSLDAACVAGFDGYFKRVNEAWTRMLGWTKEELLARPVIDFVHPDDRAGVLAGRARLKAGKEMGPLVNRYRHRDGSYRWFEWRSVAAPERELVFAVARDITERKLAEQRLREAEEREVSLQRQLQFADRMASVGTLAAGAAHEINNPLAYVTANIAMILEVVEGLADEPFATLREMALDVQEGAWRIRKIVGGLKSFSHPGDPQLAVIDVAPVVERSIAMTSNQIRHRARLVTEFGDTPLVEADETRLGQVFVNLLVNAAQAIAEGATAENEIRVVTSTDPDGRACIDICDTGVGIPPADLDRVFDPFFTTKPVGEGTGLGLSMCHTIVAGLGGEVVVTSEQGRGTTFRVVLPAARVHPSEAPAESLAAAPSTARAAVLVVDDEPAVGRALNRSLRDHAVTSVTTASEALSLLEAGERFDVIFCDLMMPEMSAEDFYGELARGFPGVVDKVIFVSGGAFTASARAFLERVPNEFLEKPFDLQRIRELLSRGVGL